MTRLLRLLAALIIIGVAIFLLFINLFTISLLLRFIPIGEMSQILATFVIYAVTSFMLVRSTLKNL